MSSDKINIAVYGSCITKDPFTTAFNKDYKKRYNCLINDQKHSLISTMQEKETVNENDLKILPDNADNRFLTKCIKEDLEKTFIDLILEFDIDYLVFDVYFEVERGIIKFDNNKLLTKITGFEKTDYYKGLEGVETISILDNPNLYFNIWKEYCDKFFDFFKKNSPQTKFILAEVRSLDLIQRDDGSIYKEDNYYLKTKFNNRYYKLLEDYIKSNYDVYVVKFDKDMLLKDNHRWGKYHVHYIDEYYTSFLQKIDEIVEYDKLKDDYQKLKEENIKLHKRIKELEDSNE